jgi:hypothetical protein
MHIPVEEDPRIHRNVLQRDGRFGGEQMSLTKYDHERIGAAMRTVVTIAIAVRSRH